MISFFLPLAVAAAAADTIDLKPGLVITRSVVVRPAPYRLQPIAPDSAVIRIKGDSIEVNFAGATLIGSPYSADPDRGRGIGVLIEGGRGITVRGATVRGYQIGILARGVIGLRLLDDDVSYNWKPRLWSGIGHESLVDWLSFHHDENDEWLRYGAGLFLIDVTGGEIRGNTARQGMNGLLMVRSTKVAVWNNDFSFLSGLGIGLYRSSDNRIMHNRVDYAIRGYRHGIYNRGQDSAALLLYEQSSRNIVAYNSMTHSGDGLFLWAGQSTMDSGQGGSNDNLFFGNDFSFAVTNGMEATFSRNRFIGNLVEGAHHGLWGGYSWGSEIRSNRFKQNVVGIAIEHGQDNRIVGNDFEGDQTAIRLWWNRLVPSDWGYPKQRDTKSRSYAIQSNRFLANRLALAVENSQKVVLTKNQYFGVDSLVRAIGDTTGLRRDARRSGMAASALAPWRPNRNDPAAPAPLSRPIDPFTRREGRGGRATILIDEWGPYDWRTPRAWPARDRDSAVVRGPIGYGILGPPGNWTLVAVRGGKADRTAGKMGDTVLVTPAPGPTVDFELELEYVGESVLTPDGATTRAGDPYRFTVRRFAAPIDWKVQAFPWDSLSDPRRSGDAYRAALAKAPLLTRRDSLLDYLWARPKLAGFPESRFVAVAEGSVELPKNAEYELVTISDDGIRVWIDDRLVIDNWTAHESSVDRAGIKSGKHRIRVEYYQVDGWVELRAEVRRRGSEAAGRKG
jgi:nitrous oxidase accessory protein NosD